MCAYLGGAVGGSLAAYMSSGKCTSLSNVIRQMDESHKEKLYKAALGLISQFSINDVAALNELLQQNNSHLRQQLIIALQDFATGDLNLEIKKS